MLGNWLGPKEQETEEHWVSISDVMAGLMVIFLFIAISYMLHVRLKANEIIVYKNEVEKLLDAYKNLQAKLSEELQAEFEGSSTKKRQFRTEWRGYLDIETLSIRFKKPFKQGEATVPNAFKSVLRDFFPRYVAILTKPEYQNEIAEIRIEGHTSSEWFVKVTGHEAYINNMELSQDRARNVLHYVLRIAHPAVTQNREWLKKNLTANGLSSSQLILDLDRTNSRPANSYGTVAKETGIPEWVVRQLHPQIRREMQDWQHSEKRPRLDIVNRVRAIQTFSNLKQEALERAVGLLTENKAESRRVEFRVVTKSEKLIDEIERLMKRFNDSGVEN